MIVWDISRVIIQLCKEHEMTILTFPTKIPVLKNRAEESLSPYLRTRARRVKRIKSKRGKINKAA